MNWTITHPAVDRSPAYLMVCITSFQWSQIGGCGSGFGWISSSQRCSARPQGVFTIELLCRIIAYGFFFGGGAPGQLSSLRAQVFAEEGHGPGWSQLNTCRCLGWPWRQLLVRMMNTGFLSNQNPFSNWGLHQTAKKQKKHTVSSQPATSFCFWSMILIFTFADVVVVLSQFLLLLLTSLLSPLGALRSWMYAHFYGCAWIFIMQAFVIFCVLLISIQHKHYYKYYLFCLRYSYGVLSLKNSIITVAS